ncbi:sugar kinase [Streptomyces sp. NPDC005017]|uniref:sugar kinase n=1 Tax=Streptomyces sp. NPDC005017 TaxID=3364706 RepID=UPI003673DA6C
MTIVTVTGAGPETVDVVALGESMVTFLPSRPGRLADVPSFERGIGGAESNVACALARGGHSVRWVSRVGADGFGDHLVEAVGAHGVDVSAVARDAGRPTGVYFRTAGERGSRGHEVAYYRAGSAASAMSVTNVDLDVVRACRVLHLSGITAAVSRGCLELMRELVAPRAGRPLISFDVNFRPGLWGDRGEARVLLELARAADVVFVGADEACDAWGLRDDGVLLEALAGPGLVVVKRGASGATAYERGGGRALPGAGRRGLVAPTRRTPHAEDGPAPLEGVAPPPLVAVHHVAAPKVRVAAAVGAGDAFAAGFLSGTLRGLSARERLRHGHLWAAVALTVDGDLAPPPSRGHAERLVALDDEAWGRLRLGPGWTRAGEVVEEVPAP